MQHRANQLVLTKQVYILSLAAIRVLSILTAILFFGWYNIFTYVVSHDASQSIQVIWIQAGVIYCLGTLLTALNWDFKDIVRKIYLLYSLGVALMLGFNLFFSYFFGQSKSMLANLVVLGIVIGNGWLVIEKKLVFEKSRWVIGVVIVIGIIGAGILSSKWDYFAQEVTCEGVSMTTAGGYEKWSYQLPRLQCWDYQLSAD